MADGSADFAGAREDVAEFLARARIKGPAAPDTIAFARGIADEFVRLYNTAEVPAALLLQVADFAIRGERLELARRALTEAAATPASAAMAFYRLGRLELAHAGNQAAIDAFSAGTQADAGFAYNWIGLARALHGAGRKPEAAQAALRFAAFATRPHAVSDLTLISDLGDFLFDSGERGASLPLYALLSTLGAASPRDAVRLAESHLTARDPAAAQRVLLAQAKRQKLDPWGRRALAAASSQLGDHDRALEAAVSVLAEAPDNPGFVSTYVDVLVRAGGAERLREALAQNEALLPGQARQEILARLRLAEGDLKAAIAALADTTIEARSRLYYLLFDLTYQALGAGEFTLALALADRLAGLAPEDIYTQLLRIDIYFRQQMWEEAGAALAALSPEQAAHPHALLKRFEHACFISDTDTAAALCTELEALDMADRQFLLPVFRFLAERKQWHALVDRAVQWLHPLFQYEQIGYVFFRAAKHTGRQVELADAVTRIEDWQTRPDLVRLRAILLTDTADTLPAIAALSRDPLVWNEAQCRVRLQARRDALLRAQAPSGRQALFFCTDRNYLCATIVALHGALAIVDAGNTDFFIVVDNDVEDLCRAAVAPLATAGPAITVVPASEVVSETEKLFPAYGLFTSGHVLASAAYYRIFFARHLQRLGTHARAVYLDSDVIVRGTLQPLFDFDLQGEPLGARNETDRPEVRRAIAAHQLPHNRYFNSGVLVFDLKHERLAPCLDAAISAILDDGVTLLFHDQCALNVGFRSGSAEIGMAWNYPVGEGGSIAAAPEDARVLHFLDRPKPWSAAYGGDAGATWFNAWRATAAAIGEATALALLELTGD